MDFCFVILHYLTSEDTIECIESILKQKAKCSIVVVDNHSDNGSLEKVQDYFKDEREIHYIKNSKNLGFASGNNVGYNYAKKVIGSEFIAVLNNDIIIETDGFINIVKEKYARKPFHIMGPDIVSLKDNKHQNPMTKTKQSRRSVWKEIIRYVALLLLSKMNLYDFLKKSHRSNDSQNFGTENFDREAEGVQLHGSFVIFSPLYINNEEFAFRPGTFLYLEEAILYEYCEKKEYICVYCPDLKVFHKEDSSTNASFENNKEKREFVFKNLIQSLLVYRKVIKNG